MDSKAMTIMDVLTPLEPNRSAAHKRNGTKEYSRTVGIAFHGASRTTYPNTARPPINATASSRDRRDRRNLGSSLTRTQLRIAGVTVRNASVCEKNQILQLTRYGPGAAGATTNALTNGPRKTA